MDSDVLVNEAIDAGEELVRQFDGFMPVKAAFWLKPSDKDSHYLFIASDRIDDANVDRAYSEVLRLSRKLQSPFLDPFKVKVISTNDPLASAAEEINVKYPGRIPTRYGGRMFGGMSVDGVYIYPSPLPTGTRN